MIKVEATWNYPTTIHAGAGRIDELPMICAQLEIKNPMVVTDPGLSKLPFLLKAVTECRQAGLNCSVFAEVSSNPISQNIEVGTIAYRKGCHDGVIAFGGGSVLDAAKAIALMAGQVRGLWDFEDVGDNWKRVIEAGVAPIIAIPTTAGTGSEVGRAAVITDTDAQVKRIIFHPRLLPSVVILDPILTTGLPAQITAATGMDALSHNLEALCAPGYHPMADGIAAEGIRLIKNNLPSAVADGNDVEARMQMLVASSMGATAFQKGLGAMHALAHPLGALYNAHHGLLNAILMPYVVQANRPAISDTIQQLCRSLTIKNGSFEQFLDWILALRQQVGIPHSLAEIGINTADARRIGRMAYNDPSAGSNPIPFSENHYSSIFCRAVDGQL